MIDMHCHIIHGVDDGPSNIEQSLQMVEEAEKLGIRAIIATPHYHESIFDVEKVDENFLELINRAKCFDVVIKMGYEVFVNPVNPSIMRNRKRLSLNKSGRLLLEFPFNARPAYCLDSIKRLKLENSTPIIAHPERNRNFLNNFGELVRFIKAGCLIQVDAASITGVYGLRIREFCKRLIQMNFVDMVASNAHCQSDYSDWYMEAYNNVIHWAGQDIASKLFFQNAKRILEEMEDNLFKNAIL